jgi:hypothetical protein
MARSSRLLKNVFGVRLQAQRDAALDSQMPQMLRNPKRRRCRRTPNFVVCHR